jgi:hypothetical protein
VSAYLKDGEFKEPKGPKGPKALVSRRRGEEASEVED